MGGPGRRGKTGSEEREGCSSAEASLPAAIPSGCHRQAALSGWRTAAFAICIPGLSSTRVGTSSATLLSVRSAAGAPRGAVHGRPTYRVLKDSMTLLMFAAFSTLGSTRACQGRETVTATRRGHADRHAGSRRKRRWCLGAPWGSLRPRATPSTAQPSFRVRPVPQTHRSHGDGLGACGVPSRPRGPAPPPPNSDLPRRPLRCPLRRPRPRQSRSSTGRLPRPTCRSALLGAHLPALPPRPLLSRLPEVKCSK